MTTEGTSEVSVVARLAGATVLAQLAQALLIMIDNVMAGRHSTQTLSEFGVSTQIIIPILVLSIGFFFSVNVIVAQHYGSKDFNALGNAVSTSITASLFCALFCVFILNNISPLLVLFGVDKALYSGIKSYMGYVSLGVVPYFLFLILRFTADGLLLAKYVMVSAVSAIPVKLFCNYLFVFGSLGFPELGVGGIGLATSITWTYMLSVLVVIFYWRKIFTSYNLLASLLAIDWKVLREIGKIGAPISFSMGVSVVFLSLTGMLISGLSSQDIASHQAAYNFIFFVSMFFQGVAVASTSRIAFLRGEGNLQALRRTIKISYSFAVGLAVINGLALYFSANYIGYIYNDDIGLVAIVSSLIVIGAIYQIPQALQETTSAILRGFKKTLLPTIVYMICFGTTLGLFVWLVDRYDLGVQGYWWGIAAGHVSASILMFCVFFYLVSGQLRNHKDLTDESHAYV